MAEDTGKRACRKNSKDLPVAVSDRATFLAWISQQFGSLDAYQMMILNRTVQGISLKKISKEFKIDLFLIFDSINNNREFLARYKEAMKGRIFIFENDLVNYEGFDEIPTTVDQLGNEDLARGYISRAKSQSDFMIKVLERKSKDWSIKQGQEVTQTVQLGVAVIPAKDVAVE